MSRPTHRRSLARVVPALALAAAIALAVTAPAGAAPPTTASFEANDSPSWDVTGMPGTHTVTIAAGGMVTFSYPSGGHTSHNADFTGSLSPSSCTQTAGPDSGPVPPLPATITGPGWSGNCRFDTPGRYTFFCDLHGSLTSGMRGTIVVVDPNAPTPPPGGGSGGGGTTPPAGGGGGQQPAPGGSTGGSGTGGGSSQPAVVRTTVAHRQLGAAVRASVAAPVAGSSIVVTALASNRALSTRPVKRVRKLRVGSQRKRSSSAGATTPFKLTLNAAARSALQRRGALAITLRIVVTPPGRRAVTKTTTVALRPRSSATTAPAPAPLYGPATLG